MKPVRSDTQSRKTLTYYYLFVSIIYHTYQRNRKHQRKRAKKQNEMFHDRHASLLPLFNNDNKISTPHTLIELSNKSYHRMKDNIIELGANSVGTYDGSDVL